MQTGSDNYIRWRTPANLKSDLGMAAVENTALSTWVGSANITTIGTLASGIVPWARLSNVPIMIGSGATHAVGLVPDPGVTPGTGKFLREDGTWT